MKFARLGLLAAVLASATCARPALLHTYELVVPAFPVPPGSEIQRCYYMKFPSDVDVDVGSLTLDITPGSHHFQVYVNDEDLPDGSEDCFQVVDFNRWHLQFATQTSAMGWKLPEGVAMRFKAHQQVMIQTHYVNAGQLSTPSGIGGGVLHFHETRDAQTHLGSIFAVNHDIHLPPHQEGSAEALCPFDRDVKIAALSGHYHFTGLDFTARHRAADGTMDEPFYTVTGFNDLKFETWDPSNAPAFAAGTAIDWHCDYNNTNDYELVFGARESDHEHCNMFVFYWPAEPQEFRVCLKHDSDGVDTEQPSIGPLPLLNR